MEESDGERRVDASREERAERNVTDSPTLDACTENGVELRDGFVFGSGEWRSCRDGCFFERVPVDMLGGLSGFALVQREKEGSSRPERPRLWMNSARGKDGLKPQELCSRLVVRRSVETWQESKRS